MIKPFEIEVRLLQITKRRDDVALILTREIGLKAQLLHALDENLCVFSVATCPPGDPTLGLQLLQGPPESKYCVRRRSKAELTVGLDWQRVGDLSHAPAIRSVNGDE